MQRAVIGRSTIALVLAVLSLPANAATFTVNSSGDTSDTPVGGCTAVPPAPSVCTLRGAIEAANAAAGADTIVFAATVSGGNTATAGSDYPVITGPVSVDGLPGGTGSTRFTVNGDGSHSLLRITGAGSYSISNLIITNARGNAVGGEANGGGGIFFNPSSASTLTLSNVDLTNNRAVSSGGAPGGGLYVGAGHTVTVTGGLVSANHTAGDASPAGSNGGGIFNAGTLTLNGTTVSNNTAAQGGGIFNAGTLTLAKDGSTQASLAGNTASGLGGGGLYNFNGTLTAADTVLSSNAASGGSAVGGGGLYSELDSGGATTLTRVTITGNTVGGSGHGGGVYARKVVSSADFSLTDSTVAGNAAAGGAGGGLFVKRGLVQVTGSTLSGNSAASSGGGIYLGVDGSGGRVALSNSTLSGNTAVVGGGIGVDKDNVATSSMVHVTLAENEASDASGGGGISYGLPADGALNPNLAFPGTFGNAFTSNIVAGNLANGAVQNCRTAFSHSNANDSGYNVTDDASCGFNQSSDRTVTSPAPLGMLADNLGGTQTHALLAGNPAIDHANPLYVTAADQRGAAPQDGDEAGGVLRDAGAYEFGGFGVMHFEQGSYTVREDAGSLTAVVRRFGNAAVATSVKVSTAADTATAPADYVSLSSQNVAFTAADVSEDVVVTINDDDVFPEAGEKFGLLLSAPQQGSDLGPIDTATVTITDVEEGAFQFAQAAYSAPEGGTSAVNENGTLTVTVTRASGSDMAVTVGYSVSGGTAVAGEDYVASSATGSLTWADGDTAPKTFDVQLLDDIKDETGGAATRTLELTLADPPGRARLGTPATTTLTLTDDDATPEVTLEINPTTFNETGGTATVTARLVGSTATADATVNLAFSGTASRDASCGTAQDPADYTCSANAITIAAGATSGSITLTGVTDSDNETDETVIVDIASTSANVAEQGTQQVTATIAEVAAVRGDLSLSSATYTALEASGSLVVTVTRANGDDGAASVQCTTQDGSAVAGTDFSSTPSPATLNWADSESGDKTCTFTLVNDTDRESNKLFTVKLANATGAGLGTTAEAAVTLVSDEQPRFQFNLTTTLVQEGTMGFPVAVEALDAVDGEPVTIGYFTADGTATTAGMDYSEASGSFTWSNGDGSTKTFTIAMIGADGVVEGNETFTVNLGAPVGGGVVVANNPTTVTIVDPPAVRFKAASFASTDEQDAGVIQACVERIGNPQGAVSVEYDVAGGTATAGTDYTPPPGTPMHVLSWASNDTADKCFDITILGDTVDEADETIGLSLLNPSSGLSIGDPNPAQAVITDDDDPPVVTLAIDPATLAEEGAGNSTTLTATLTGTTSSTDVVVNLVYGGAAANGTDYIGAAAITVPAGQSSASITLTATADTIDEGSGEDLTATIDSVGANATIGSPSAVSATITDDDAVTVSFQVTAQSVTEGTGAGTTTVTVTAVRTGGSALTVTAPYTLSGTAANPADHNAVAGSFSFPPSASASQTASATFTVVRDSLDEPGETVIFTLGTPSGGDVSLAAPTQHTVTITDDDTATVVVTQSGGSTAVVEGGASDTFTVVLASQPTTNVTVMLSPGAQLGVAPATLTFTTVNWNVAQTVTVSAVDDDQVEGDHTGNISGSFASGDAAYNGVLAPIIVSVTDNDSVAAGEQAPGIVVTPSGNVATSGGGGAFSWGGLLMLLGLAGRRRRGAVLGAVLALLPGLAAAQGGGTKAPAPGVGAGLSYDSADLRYLLVQVDEPGVDASGFSLSGSRDIGRSLYLLAGYASVETDTFTLQGTSGSSKTDTLALGLGWHRTLNARTDMTAAISLLNASAEGQGGFAGSADDTGFSLEAGLRGVWAPRWEWAAALSHVSIFDDTDTALTGQALYAAGANYSLLAGAGFGGNGSQFNLGVRWRF